MNDDERRNLIEQVAGAWRPRSALGDIRNHPAWHDLDDDGRREAAALAAALRRLEAALDPSGLSTSGKAVLTRIRGGG